MNLKKIFRKKEYSGGPTERPWNMPEIPEKQLTVSHISNLLREKRPIWAWFSILQKPNDTVYYFLTGNRIDGFGTWILNGEYLFEYIAYFDDRGAVILRLTEIRRMTNSNILELINSTLQKAYCVMYDDQNHTANVKVIATDITQEMIESELQNKEKWHIGPEHFLTK